MAHHQGPLDPQYWDFLNPIGTGQSALFGVTSFDQAASSITRGILSHIQSECPPDPSVDYRGKVLEAFTDNFIAEIVDADAVQMAEVALVTLAPEFPNCLAESLPRGPKTEGERQPQIEPEEGIPPTEPGQGDREPKPEPPITPPPTTPFSPSRGREGEPRTPGPEPTPAPAPREPQQPPTDRGGVVVLPQEPEPGTPENGEEEDPGPKEEEEPGEEEEQPKQPQELTLSIDYDRLEQAIFNALGRAYALVLNTPPTVKITTDEQDDLTMTGLMKDVRNSLSVVANETAQTVAGNQRNVEQVRDRFTRPNEEDT